MLKSTHRPAEQPQEAPLPAGWTQHTAPTGHFYYYNAATQQSTYTRPVEEPQNLPNQNLHLLANNAATFPPNQTYLGWQGSAQAAGGQHGQAHGRSGHGRGDFRSGHHDRGHRADRPKSKHTIPGCAPWVLVKTKLGRRFVHNLETKESLWKFPKDVIGGVVEYDIQQRKKQERRDRGEASEEEDENEAEAQEHAASESNERPMIVAAAGDHADEEAESDEYEEVEVTDDEFEDEDNPHKRQKLGDENAEAEQLVEFGEDDMAYQLAAMGETYQLDQGEFGQEGEDGFDEEWEEGAEGIPLTEAETKASFEDLLDDHAINPFTTWDSVIAEGRIIDDDRYTLLPNMKARKEVFAEWSAARIQSVKQVKEKQAKQDPRISYLALLQQHATPKLFWPEFRRKFKKEAAMKDAKLADKDREKLYREHISRTTKLPEATLMSDLTTLLASLPPSASWNRATSMDAALPTKLLADVRYISLRPSTRDDLIGRFMAGLPSASEISPEEAAADAAP